MNIMLNGITGSTNAASVPADAASVNKEKQKQLSAAQDFESMLLGQMLHSMREEGSGWLGTGDDDASAVASGFGEDQLARALTKGGGLGLSRVIAEGLAAKSAAAASNVAADNPAKP